MKVIGAGQGRTGTTSLRQALIMLGFPKTYHMDELFDHPEHLHVWHDASQGKKVDWQNFMGEYDATIDNPSAFFYKELMAAFPDAKVILTARDPAKWYESAYNTIFQREKQKDFHAKIFGDNLDIFHEMCDRIQWDGIFHGNFEDREYGIEMYKKWNEDVRRYVPKENLLEYDVSQGWAPLCAFLGVEVPDKPFPCSNQTNVFWAGKAGF